MRTLSITLIALALVSCSFGKKRKSKSAIIKTETTNTTSKPDPCQTLIKLVAENRKTTYFTEYGKKKRDTTVKTSYWPWSMDSVVLFANSNCWNGVDKKFIDSIFGKPFRVRAIGNDFFYLYKVTKNYNDALKEINIQNWEFIFEDNKVKGTYLERKKGVFRP